MRGLRSEDPDNLSLAALLPDPPTDALDEEAPVFFFFPTGTSSAGVVLIIFEGYPIAACEDDERWCL